MRALRGGLLALALLAMPLAAHAETRVALVIGNSNYAHAPRLANPVNDASVVSQSLRSIGFSVTTQNDLGKSAIEAALHRFTDAASNADIAVIYYAGHGMEIGGTNYLVPVDASLAHDSDVQFETVPLDLLMTAVNGARRLKLVVMDACRNNPFAVHMAGARARAIGRGLAPIDPGGGTLVFFAARDGTTAEDGQNGNSPFAAAFARNLPTPGLEVNFLFRKVRDDVLASTQHRQEPFYYGSLSSEAFYFVPPKNGAPPVAAAPARPAPPDALTIELAYWDSIKGSSDAADFRSYLAQYPRGAFASLARNRIASLEKPAPVPPHSRPAPLPAPDTASSILIADVGAPAINCVFVTTCTMTVNDSIDKFTPPGDSGSGQLQSRTFSGVSPAPAAGMMGYQYRLDMTTVTPGQTANCVRKLQFDFGSVRNLPYKPNAGRADLYVIKSGGLGSVGIDSATLVNGIVSFEFAGNGVCPGATSYFFGLASPTTSPEMGTATLFYSLGGSATVAVRAP